MDTQKRVIGLEIRAMRKACEDMAPYQRADCPICGWPLRVSIDNIIECMFCGWTDQNPIVRNIEHI